MPGLSDEKAFVFDFHDRNAKAFATLSDSIFYFAELGMQEYETVGLMTRLLEAEGFAIERNLSGFPTSFLARYGRGDGPVIAIHGEYDANPDNSQRSGATSHEPILRGSPGHCEGHNVNGAVLVTSAIAVKRAMERYGLNGTLKIIGAPAEEQALSRPYFVRDGYFDDVDVAFHEHIGSDFAASYGPELIACVSAKFIFHGESAHAAFNPWDGRDALDAVVMMDVGMAQYREHMKPTMRAHRVITEGGHQPNVIPARAAVWWYFRDPSAEAAHVLFEQAKKIAQGAALMTNTTLEIDLMSAVWPVWGNPTIAEILHRNIEAIGVPEWTVEEQDFARKLQDGAKVRVEGLRTDVKPLKRASTISASNDCGDVSWVVPMGRYTFPANVPNCAFHHWSAGAALATSIAHKGGVAGSKALAGSVLDILMDPSLADQAKATFREQCGGVSYKPFLPPDQKPPLDLNRDMMEAWRPRMRPNYIAELPLFV